MLFRLIILGAVFYLGWRVSRWFRKDSDSLSATERARQAAEQATQETVQRSLDLVPCPRCGAYLPRGASCSCHPQDGAPHGPTYHG